MTHNKKLKLAVVHSVKCVRDSITEKIEKTSNFSVTHSFSELRSTELISLPPCPDALLLDVSQNRGFDYVQELVNTFPSITLVVWGLSATEEDVLRWAKYGVSGYVTCDDSIEQLVHSIESAVRNEISNARIAGVLNRYIANQFRSVRRQRPHIKQNTGRVPAERPHYQRVLTSRETEIIELINEGMSNKEIARMLNLELSTVKNHVHSILAKFQVSRRTLAAAQYRSLSQNL